MCRPGPEVLISFNEAIKKFLLWIVWIVDCGIVYIIMNAECEQQEQSDIRCILWQIYYVFSYDKDLVVYREQLMEM